MEPMFAANPCTGGHVLKFRHKLYQLCEGRNMLQEPLGNQIYLKWFRPLVAEPFVSGVYIAPAYEKHKVAIHASAVQRPEYDKYRDHATKVENRWKMYFEDLPTWQDERKSKRYQDNPYLTHTAREGLWSDSKSDSGQANVKSLKDATAHPSRARESVNFASGVLSSTNQSLCQGPNQGLDNKCNKLNVNFPDFSTKSVLLIDIRKHPEGLDEALRKRTPRVSGRAFQNGSPLCVGGRAGKSVAKRSPQLKEVKELHSHMMESGKELHLLETNTLMDMYVKCGSMVDARHVFDNMTKNNVVSWNMMILGYAKQEEGALALELYAQMCQEGVQPSDRTFVGALKACSSVAALEEGKPVCGISVKIGCLEKGKAIHSQILKCALEANVYVGTTLVDMYTKCGSIEDARLVFDELLRRDVVSWNAMIFGYTENRRCELALDLYVRMKHEGVIPDHQTFVGALKACSSLVIAKEGQHVDGDFVTIGCLEAGRAIYSDFLKSGIELDGFMGTTLVHMYAKCGSMDDAQHVFETLPAPTVVSFNAMIMGYVTREEGEVALEWYARVRQEGVIPVPQTFVSALKACSSLAMLEDGKQVDQKFVKIRSLEKGRTIHLHVLKSLVEVDLFLGTTLVDMYTKCGSMEDAQLVFDDLPHGDVVSWNAMIAGYTENQEGEVALQLYVQMQHEGIIPDDRTVVGALKACSSLATLDEGKQVDGKFMKEDCLHKGRALYSQVLKHGFEANVFVGNSLVHMYTKCGSMEDAHHVFDDLPHRDVVSWNAMILGYAEKDEGQVALDLYARMQQEGVIPHQRTFIGALKACSSLATLEEGKNSHGKLVKRGALEKGKNIHFLILKSELESDVVISNSLVYMYTRCGSMDDAQHVFDQMSHRTVVSWNTMIWGYAEQEQSEEAFKLYSELQDQGQSEDLVTFLGILKACATTAALETGQKIHSQICKSGVESNTLLASTLIDMYGKCGSMVDAQKLFDVLTTRDVVLWNVLIRGYARQGDSGLVFHLFDRMRKECIQPNGVTFLSVLSVCSHAGLLDEALKYFQAMSKQCCIRPAIEHYNCMIDLLGRAGQVDEAVAIVEKMPFQPNRVALSSVLGACQNGENVETGRYAFEYAVKMDEKHPAAYVLMSSIYARAHEQ